MRREAQLPCIVKKRSDAMGQRNTCANVVAIRRIASSLMIKPTAFNEVRFRRAHGEDQQQQNERRREEAPSIARRRQARCRRKTLREYHAPDKN